MVLNFSDEFGVVWKNEVDCHSLSTESTSSTDSVDVVLLLEWELIVDDETNLLDIDTSSQEIGGNENSGGSSSELLHDGVSLDLVHLTMHGRNGEVMLIHGLLELENSLFGVAVNQGLVDVQVRVEIKENLHLPLFLLDGDVVLTDTFECKVFALDKNFLWISHEVLGQSQDIVWHGGREESDLDVTWEVLEHILDLLLESSRQHLIGLVHDEESEIVGLEESFLHHVENSSWGSNDGMNTLLEELDVLSDAGTTDTGVNLNTLVLTDLVYNVCDLERKLSSWGYDQCLDVAGCGINDLKGRNGESTRFTGSRLSLSDGIVTLNNR